MSKNMNRIRDLKNQLVIWGFFTISLGFIYNSDMYQANSLQDITIFLSVIGSAIFLIHTVFQLDKEREYERFLRIE